MRARADVPEALDRRPVAGRRGERPPEQVLVERAAARVDVAGDEVRVERLEVGGREGDALQRRRAEVLDRLAEPRDDPVGVRLAQLLRPGAVADVELARGVASHAAGRELLQLQPENRLALGRARRVDGAGLPDDDRRLGGEQAAIGLVHRARDSVETRGDVDDRRLAERLAPTAAPPRRLVEREVDLHPGAAVAEPPRGVGDLRRGVAVARAGGRRAASA